MKMNQEEILSRLLSQLSRENKQLLKNNLSIRIIQDRENFRLILRSGESLKNISIGWAWTGNNTYDIRECLRHWRKCLSDVIKALKN